MDKFKNFVRIEELKTLLKQGRNEEALEQAEGMEPKKIKDNCDLMVLAEVYLGNGMLGKARECYLIIYDRKKSRRVAMELVNVCIRLKNAEDAEKYYRDYRKMAPNDYFNYIFKYKIDRLKGRPLAEQAADLEQLKNKEFFDTWGYELAKLYHKMGETEKCLRTCEDIIVWFGDGEAVDKAKALKAYYSGEITLKDLNNPEAVKKQEETVTIEAAKEDFAPEESIGDFYNTKVVVATKESTETDEFAETDKLADTEAFAGTEEELEEVELAETRKFTPVRESSEADKSVESEETNNSAELQNTAGNAVYETGEEEMELEEGFAAEDEKQPETSEEEMVLEEETSDSKENTREENTEEENTEENKEEFDDIKIAPERPKRSKPVITENDFFTDAIAKAVEEALIEDSKEKERREENLNPQDMTREWRRPEPDKKKEVPAEKNDKPEVKVKQEERIEKKREDSRLMNAVERELGIVGADEDEDEKSGKKSWRERRKEKHLEKERKKQEIISQKAEDKLEKEQAAELEKRRFIENEKRKDRQKFLAHQKQIARLANEKAKEEIKKEEIKKEQSAEKVKDVQKENESDSADKFTVDIGAVQEVLDSDRDREKSRDKDKVHVPKKLPCIEIPRNSIIVEYLAGTGKTLEDYFGFFACQREMNSQILKCLERLLDPEEEYMNYCLIGERGSGKKAIVHGFARFMADCRKLASNQTVWTDANKVNMIDLSEKTDKLKGRCLVIDQAGTLDTEAIEDISKVTEKVRKKAMLVIADYRRNIVELFRSREKFEELFSPRVCIPDFNQDDLIDYVDYKTASAGYVFSSEAYDMILKRVKSIIRATEEGTLARTEKFMVKIFDNVEQRNGEAYIRQTLEHVKPVRSNVIIPEDIPESL